MPSPVSCTASWIWRPRRLASTRTVPSAGVCRTAFTSGFCSTLASRGEQVMPSMLDAISLSPGMKMSTLSAPARRSSASSVWISSNAAHRRRGRSHRRTRSHLDSEFARDIDDLRVLVHHRRELQSERTRAASRLHADLEQLRPGYQERIGRLTTERNLDRARRLLSGDDRVRAEVARERVRRLRQLSRQIARITDEIGALSATFGSGLTTITGIAELSTAELLAEIGDIDRYRTKSQFAMANGTAPLPASSGRIDRHRLNRGGNRQLNRIIHYVALTQISRSPEGRAHYERKRAQGKTTKEALRCLKRRISDRIFVTLRASVLT